MLRYLHFIGFMLLASCILAQSIPWQATPKREVRAVWLTTIGGLDWPHGYAQSAKSIEKQKRQLCEILNAYQRAGINTVLLQTRIRGTVIYPSQYEPFDGCLSGVPGRSPGYDALQYAITQCHLRGMEIQAWVVTLPLGKWNGLGCRHIRKNYPQAVTRIGNEAYMNPESKETPFYLAKLCGEITRQYDIDGIHLDYIRYPETWKRRVSNEKGIEYISNIVRCIHDTVKAIKPWVKISCAPIGKYDDLSRYWSHGWNALHTVCQDAQSWLNEDLMDELYPMMYFRGNQFYPFAIDWKERSYGKPIAPGLGIYFLSSEEGNWAIDDITREINVLRQYKLGQAYFRGNFLTNNTKGIFEYIVNNNSNPALVPALKSPAEEMPSPPTAINITEECVSWQGNTPFYNLYSSRTQPVDVTNAQNLIATRLTSTSIKIPTTGRYFAVTGLNRYGIESGAIQSQPVKEPATSLLPCKDLKIQIPTKPSDLDAEWLIAENLEGMVIAIWTWKGHSIPVSALQKGFYKLKSLNKKGVTHKIGFFWRQM